MPVEHQLPKERNHGRRQHHRYQKRGQCKRPAAEAIFERQRQGKAQDQFHGHGHANKERGGPQRGPIFGELERHGVVESPHEFPRPADQIDIGEAERNAVQQWEDVYADEQNEGRPHERVWRPIAAPARTTPHAASYSISSKPASIRIISCSAASASRASALELVPSRAAPKWRTAAANSSLYTGTFQKSCK